MKKVLITGAAGMVGSHLIDELADKDVEITAIDHLEVGRMENIQHHLERPNFNFIKMDILDLENLFLQVRETDTIVHLAATKKISEEGSGFRTLTVNAKGTENVLKLARALNSKVVFGSTSDVYGMSPDLPFKEDGNLLLGPSLVKRWSYAVAKLYGEQMMYAFYKEYDVPIVILRYFGAFSERASFSWSGGHVPIFIDQILNDEEVPIHGDGSQTRSMGHVSDLVSGTLLAMETEKAIGETINIGNHEELSVLDTAKMIHEVAQTGKPLKIKSIPLEDIFGSYKDIARRVPDLSKAKRILGFTPKITLKDAIVMTIEERKKALTNQ